MYGFWFRYIEINNDIFHSSVDNSCILGNPSRFVAEYFNILLFGYIYQSKYSSYTYSCFLKNPSLVCSFLVLNGNNGLIPYSRAPHSRGEEIWFSSYFLDLLQASLHFDHYASGKDKSRTERFTLGDAGQFACADLELFKRFLFVFM